MEAFVTASILEYFDCTREVVVETDTLDLISAGVLSQQRDDGVLHQVVFYSKKHSPQKQNIRLITRNCWQ